jgi:MerR family transcriptional regulator/heat shock protein HspR
VAGHDKARAVYGISVASHLCDLHPQTIRQYERQGLIRPERSRGGTRHYSDIDIERIRLIASLTRDMGVNLAGVEIILRMREREVQLLELAKGMFANMDDASRARFESLVLGNEPGLVPSGPSGLARKA